MEQSVARTLMMGLYEPSVRGSLSVFNTIFVMAYFIDHGNSPHSLASMLTDNLQGSISEKD